MKKSSEMSDREIQVAMLENQIIQLKNKTKLNS